jgi:hypothetical protein
MKGRSCFMSRFGSLLSKIQNIFTDYCEFKDICPYFDPDQFTCVNSGGSRCGKYRRFKAEHAVNELEKPK